MVDFNEARSLISQYEDVYRARHEAFRALRKYWHGDYWKMADYEQSRPITSIFRDLTAHMSDIGPEIKLVHNVIQQVCVKYQTFLTPLPQIRVWTDPPETDNRRAQATRKERFLYGCWAMGNMDKIFNRAGWYLPLMGDCFLGIHPDFDKNIPVPLVRSPEYAYPIPGFDKNSEQAICFRWKVAESVAAREYSGPVFELQQARQGMSSRGQATNPQVEIIEYSDDNEWHRWIANVGPRSTAQSMGETWGEPVEINGIEHNFGFNLFEHLKFINVPDEIWGHGAVEQAINMNEMGNALLSLLFQAVIENVFPLLVLEGAEKAPEEIDKGPGGVVPLLLGGKAYYLSPPVQSLPVQQQFTAMNDHNIKEVTGMPEVQFGQTEGLGSIVTGKAINELQGAGTGSMVEMVQGVGIGHGIVDWNEKAITIGQKLFREDTMYLYGREYKTSFDLVANNFALSIKGKELIGSARNDVIFSPAINPHEKLVMWLQAKGGGLVSDKYIREQIGIPDNEAMVEEMLSEAAEQAVLGALLGEIQQSPTPETAASIEGRAFSYLQGGTGGGPPHPLLGLQGGPGAGAPALGAGGGMAPQPPAPGTPPNPGQPGGVPAGAPAPPTAAGQGQATGIISLNEAIAAFGSVQGITGRVFLVGEIVERQQTNQDIEVAVNDPADRTTIAGSLPQYSGKLTFHVISGAPNEPYVEVTPGQPPRRGGAEQNSPEALRRVFVG